jgi:predicted SnoaL-like aldol condensation-catalyzing enzyme
MSKTTPEESKALVLEAYDTLFNKREYEADERFWSDNYIEHSAHIESGRDGSSDHRTLDVLQDEATQVESRSGLPMFGDRFPASRR